MLISCSSGIGGKSGKNGDNNNLIVEKPIPLSPFLAKIDIIDVLKGALSDANVSSPNVTLTSTADKNDVITFNFTDANKNYEQSFKSNGFEYENGILIAKNVEVLDGFWIGCSDNKGRCFKGENAEEIKAEILKQEFNNQTYQQLSYQDKIYIDDFIRDVSYGRVNDVETFSLKLFGSNLSYSNFGVVEKREKLSAVNDQFYRDKLFPYYFENGYAKEYDKQSSYYIGYGDPSKKQEFTNNTFFTGKAFATVYYANDFENLTGNANLTVDNSGNKNLQVALNNYYTLKFNNGNYSNFSGTNNLGSNFDIRNNLSGSANYQGYGDGSVEEVVGVFDICNAELGINGSFGVKKQ
ncbi:MAG: hypothetical protein Ta2D_09220 [Rickettsiales bacterium]|nr:MAG: hypothetical protein Ta2D_09220 [Rickettsiales bacterium]